MAHPHMAQPDEWLSLGQVAELLGVHPSTIRNWSNQGDFPVSRTAGGHRRYRRSDVELWARSNRANGEADYVQIEQAAIGRVRIQISEGSLSDEPWYQKLDGEAREQYRRSGRILLHSMIAYLNAEGNAAQAEAHATGFEYAAQARRSGLTSTEAMSAFIFFRNLMMHAMLSVYEEAGISSPRVWSNTTRRMTAFTDQVMLALVENYEAYTRSDRDRSTP